MLNEQEPAPADALIGQIVADRYEVLRLIGAGGMGAIYEVRHLELHRSFAMKVLSAKLADQREALARFKREAEIIGRLRHPNVVEIVDIHKLPDGASCMVMELLEGEDLAARLRAKGPFPWKAIAQMADQILSALSVAHQHGIVHRDLKPQNIFVLDDDAVNVLVLRNASPLTCGPP